MRKNIIRIVALSIAALMLLGMIASIMQMARAESLSLDKGIYAYGVGLTEEEINETSNLLDIEEKNIQKVSITAEDAMKYIGEENNDSSMVSSIYAETNDRNEIEVEIMTPLTIKNVTSIQYSNAAITAGLNNVDIKVAAVRPVTGTSALTGVYKLMELTNNELDEERTKLANEEIKIINVIAENHADDENFSKEKLNQTVIEVKQDLVEKKEENGNISDSEIGTIINNVVKDNNLDQVINDVDIENLQVMFSNFINIENLNLNVVKNQLKNLAENAPEMAEEELNKVKELLNTEKGKEFLNQINDGLSKENLENVLNKAKSAIDSSEVESVLDNLKNSVSQENINNVIEGAKDSIDLDSISSNTGGFLDSISNFFEKLFKSISDFFEGIF